MRFETNCVIKTGVAVQIFKAMLVTIAIISVSSVLNGCSSALIDKRIGSEYVTVVGADKVASCQSKGKFTVNVLSKVGFIDRSTTAIDANLLQMARNGAIDAGGDTIVQGERADAGTQTFSVYKCRASLTR
jgi:hypothetical protein